MCRMLVAVGNVPVSRLIDGFLSMVTDRNALHEYNEDRHGTFLHSEGWGISYVKAGELVTERFLTPPYEDGSIERFRGLKTTLLVLHARKATFGTRIIENVHPFDGLHPRLGNVSFCHNGGVSDSFELDDVTLLGDADTERYMHALLKSMVGEDIEAELDSFVASLHSFSGANCILATAEGAYVATRYRETPRYYTMHRHDGADLTIVSSEPLEGFDGWVPVGERAVISLPLRALSPVPR